MITCYQVASGVKDIFLHTLFDIPHTFRPSLNLITNIALRALQFKNTPSLVLGARIFKDVGKLVFSLSFAAIKLGYQIKVLSVICKLTVAIAAVGYMLGVILINKLVITISPGSVEKALYKLQAFPDPNFKLNYFETGLLTQFLNETIFLNLFPGIFDENNVLFESIVDTFNNRRPYLMLYGLNIRNIPNIIFSSIFNYKVLNLCQSSLESLPESIGNYLPLEELDLSFCDQLQSLPESIGKLKNLKSLNLLGTRELTTLPNSIFNLPSTCEIRLIETSIPSAFIARIEERVQQPGYVGPQFIVSAAERREKEKTTEELLQNIYETLKLPIPHKIKSLYENSIHDENLRSFLSRLSWTADGQNSGPKRNALYNKVHQFLQLAIEDETFRGVFQTALFEATRSCGDRVTLFLVYLEVEKQLLEIDKNDLLKLADFLKRGGFAIQELTAIAENKIKIKVNPKVDNIEVYLGYLMKLKESLNLPFSADDMRFFNSSYLTQQDLEDAKQFVSERLNNQDAVNEYLITNSTWLSALEAKYPKEFAEILQNASKDGINPKAGYLALTQKSLMTAE